MGGTGNRQTLILTGLMMVLVMTLLAIQPAADAALSHLPRGERRDLSEALDLMLRVAASRDERQRLDEAIAEVRAEIDRLEEILAGTEERYRAAQGRVIASLRWIHRLGPTSYLEILFGSSSLRDFLYRTEMALTAARATMENLLEIQEQMRDASALKEEIETGRQELAGLLSDLDDLEEIERELDRAASRLAQDYGSQRWDSLWKELSRLEELWLLEAAPYLEGLPGIFSRMAQRPLPTEGMTIVPSLFTVRVIIPAHSLNDHLADEPSLEGVSFGFAPGEARLKVEHLEVLTAGTLEISERGILTYTVTSWELGGLPLDSRHLRGVFEEIKLDLSSSLEGLKPTSLTVTEGAVELVVSFVR